MFELQDFGIDQGQSNGQTHPTFWDYVKAGLMSAWALFSYMTGL